MKNLIWLSAYLIISAIFSSCSKDDENTSIIPEGEKTNVNVSLNIAPINAMGTNINDNRTSIENFWLLEFDQQGKNVAVIKELRFSINSAETVELVAGANMKLVVHLDSVYDLCVLSLEKYSSFLHNSLSSTNILINNE